MYRNVLIFWSTNTGDNEERFRQRFHDLQLFSNKYTETYISYKFPATSSGLLLTSSCILSYPYFYLFFAMWCYINYHVTFFSSHWYSGLHPSSSIFLSLVLLPNIILFSCWLVNFFTKLIMVIMVKIMYIFTQCKRPFHFRKRKVRANVCIDMI